MNDRSFLRVFLGPLALSALAASGCQVEADVPPPATPTVTVTAQVQPAPPPPPPAPPPPPPPQVVEAPPPPAPPASEVVVEVPPPAPVVVVEAPPPPSPGVEFVWAPGYHRWWGGRYVWIRGHYEHRPRPGARYYGGHWERRPRGHVWVEAHWD
jgi:hypothetical protein